MEQQWTFQAGQVPHAVWLQMTKSHESILAELYGGTRPHLGAWAAAGPEQPVTGGAFGTHQELPLARETAEKLSAASGCNVVCVCGIHVDHASREEINLLCANAAQVIEEAVRQLSKP